MRVPTYFFQSLESIFYFRMRVPTDLQPLFNRTELKKSLRTKNKTVALRRCRQYVVAAEQVFESLRLSHFKAELTGTNLVDISSSDQKDSHRSIRDRERQLWNKVFKAADLAASYNDSLPTLDSTTEPAPALPSSAIPPVQQFSQRMPLSELIRLYITEVTDQRGQVIAKGIEKNLLRFMKIVTDKPIDRYSVEDKLRYRDVLQLMPKCINRKEYQGMSIDDIVKMDRPAGELLSTKTVNMRLIEVATLFNWAVNNAVIESHPFKKAVLKNQKSDDAERQRYPMLISRSSSKICHSHQPSHQNFGYR